MSDLLKYDLLGASEAIKSKEISSVELTNAYIEAMERTSSLGAYLEIVKDKALEMAIVSDENISQGVSRPLEGLPIGVKDIFNTFHNQSLYQTYSSEITARQVLSSTI